MLRISALARAFPEGPLTAPDGVRVLRIFSRLNVGGPAVHVILLAAGSSPAGLPDDGSRSARRRRGKGTCSRWPRAKSVHCVRLPGLGREIRPLADVRALSASYG